MIQTFGIGMYIGVSICCGYVSAAMMLEGAHMEPDSGEYAAAGFVFLCAAAIWPVGLPLIGIGWVIKRISK